MVASVSLLLGTIFDSKLVSGVFLYWIAVMLTLRGTSYMINIVPLYYKYTEEDFYIMLWGPVVIGATGYLFICVYTNIELIQEAKPKGKK